VKRRLFNLAAAVSLVFFLATMALWVRSFWQGDAVEFACSTDPAAQEWRLWTFAHAQGAVWVLTQRDRPGYGITYRDLPTWQYVPVTMRRHPMLPEFVQGWHDYGWYAPTGPLRGEERLRGFFLPWWVIVTLFATLPAAWTARYFRRLRAARLSRKNHCPTCGYDLRATPGRCPECGIVPDVEATTAT
jgi:hypothetical protein